MSSAALGEVPDGVSARRPSPEAGELRSSQLGETGSSRQLAVSRASVCEGGAAN